jgi:hypothetical protein
MEATILSSSFKIEIMNHFVIQMKLYLRKPSFLFMGVLFSCSCFLLLGAILENSDLSSLSLSLRLFWIVFELVLVLFGFLVWYPEQQSRFHQLVRGSSFSKSYYLLSKVVLISIYLFLLLLIQFAFWGFFFHVNLIPFLSVKTLVLGLFYSLLSSLMIVMLSGLLLSCSVRDLAFPVLFFPLRAGVLLIVSELSDCLWVTFHSTLSLWVWLLLSCFCLFLLVFLMFSNLFYDLIA